MFVLLCQKCNSCGGEMAMKMFHENPSEEQIEEVKQALGGNFCINNYVFELRDDEIVLKEKEE